MATCLNLTINAIRDASGAVHHYAGVIEDITEARRAHERLLLAGSVFDHAHKARIMITNPQGLIIEVNDAFSRITGFSREDVLGPRAPCWVRAARAKIFLRNVGYPRHRTGK